MNASADVGGRFPLLLIVVACGIAMASAPAAAAPAPVDEVEIENAAEIWRQEGAAWPRWSAHDESSKAVVDNQFLVEFLAQYADHLGNRGALDYVYIQNRGLGLLDNYLFALQKVSVSKLSRDEQLAYWLNLHNARAIETTALSLKTVFEDSDTARSLIMGPKWREKSLVVEGEHLSLVDIERRIVMRQWGDPVVQYGLYMPAMGHPKLPVAPFTGATVHSRLVELAREFVNSELAIEFRDGRLHVSAIYYWDQDLLPTDAAIVSHLQNYAAPALKTKLAGTGAIAASYLNWRVDSFNSGYDLHQDHQGGACPL